MSIASLKDLYLEDLGDLYDAENQMIRALPRLAEAARAPELKEALTRHGDESRLHLERLQLIFTHWGEKLPMRRCAGLAGIVQEADNRLTEPATDDARDAAIVGAAQRIEHYEIAAYGCLRTYASRLNRPDEARLLQETLDEEGRADHRLTEIAEAHVNDDARFEGDFDPSERAALQLQYVDVRQLADARLSGARLEVRNDADDKLGTFDGFIVDAASGTPRYIVVDARGLFSWRRSLLPVSLIRFDPSAGVLRAPLDKEIASRYPAFDRDEFDAMDERMMRAYEGRLLSFFPEANGRLRVPPIAEGEPPEWLVASVWLTVPPGQPDPLTRERSLSPGDESRNEAGSVQEKIVARGDAERGIHQEKETFRSTNPEEAPTPPHGEKLR
jgi:ferritin-like metal-binding protein YciE